MEKQEAIDRLREIQEEIGDLVSEAKDIIKEVAPDDYERARRYWAAHIEGALSKNYGWLGGSFVDMDETIREIEESEEEPDEESYDDRQLENNPRRRR